MNNEQQMIMFQKRKRARLHSQVLETKPFTQSLNPNPNSTSLVCQALWELFGHFIDCYGQMEAS